MSSETMEEQNENRESRFADNKSLLGLALMAVLVVFGITSTVAEWISPSEHRSVRESVRSLGEAVESEYGILLSAADSTAPSDSLTPDMTIKRQEDED